MGLVGTRVNIKMKKINQNVFFPKFALIVKNQHDFEAPEILNPDNCYGYRRCTLCSIQVFDNFHNYYEIKKDSKCRMHEKCNLCGHERLGQTRHNWKYDESGQKFV